MSPLYLLILVLAWWLAGGFYAHKQAVARNLAEQPSLASALLQGPFWVRRMLIWSTMPEQPKPEVERPEERGRVHLPNSPQVLNPLAAAAASGIGPQTVPGQQPLTPVPQPVAQAAPVLVPQAFNPETGLSPTPAPQVAPAPMVAPGEVFLPEDLQMPPQRPKRLPGKPYFGSVKSLCPACGSKQKFDKQAVCASCGSVSPWLAEKWGLQADSDQAQAPQPIAASEQPQPLAAPEALQAPQPLGAPQPIAASEQPQPLAAPEALQAPQPLDAPQAVKAEAPQPLAAPEALQAPQPVKAEAPQPIKAPEPQVEEAKELPPAGAKKPKRLPGKPIIGNIKSQCPWCQHKRSYGKDAACQECGQVNPWLAEKWGIAEPEAAAPDFSAEVLSAARYQPQQEDQLVELDRDAEIEAFDDLTDRPKRGSVQTVCPTCHKRTKHNRKGECGQCSKPNQWLLKRWGEVPMAEPLTVAPVQPQEAQAPAVDPSLCGGCGRGRAVDLEGNCIFCGHALEVGQ